MPRHDTRLGRPVLLKREDLQPVFSFKLRGAYNKMSGSDPASSPAAWSAPRRATMRRAWRWRRRSSGPGGDRDAAHHAGDQGRCLPGAGRRGGPARRRLRRGPGPGRSLEAEQGLTFLHPFDDPEVIAGQGTIGMEILQQHTGPIEAIFVPVGGGGLAAGIATFVKYLRPETKVIGVEPDDAACMAAALAAGELVLLPTVGLFADGVAVRQAGEETFRLCREHLDEVITVDTDAMCAAVKDIFDDTRAVSEPSGALALAGRQALRRAREGRPTARSSRSRRGRTSTSTGCAISPSGPRSASSARSCSASPSRSSPAPTGPSSRPWGRGRSPSSTTATRRAPRRRSSWASTSPGGRARSRG